MSTTKKSNIKQTDVQVARAFTGTAYPHNYQLNPLYEGNQFYDPNVSAYKFLNNLGEWSGGGLPVITPKEGGEFEISGIGEIKRSEWNPIVGLSY